MPEQPTKQPRLCYGLLPAEMADPSIKEVTPIVIKEGESGYHPTNWKWDKQYAEQARDAKNLALGISSEEAERMLIASMFPKGKGGET